MIAIHHWLVDRFRALQRQPVLASVAILLTVCILSADIGMLFFLHKRALGEGTREIRNLSYLLLEQTDRSLQSVSLVTNTVVDHLEAMKLDSIAEFEKAAGDLRVRFLLREKTAGLQHIDNVSITSVRGRLVNRSRIGALPEVDLSQREYLNLARTSAPGELIISGPAKSVTTGQWSIFLSKRIEGASGQYLGVVSAVLELQTLQELYAKVARGPNGSISIVRRDGVLLVRYPQIEQLLGKPVGGSGAVAQFVITRKTGVTRVISPTDGQDRITSAHSSSAFPISILVTSTVNDVLADWREDRTILTLGGLLGCFGVLGFTLLVAGASEDLANARSAILVAQEREKAQEAERAQNAKYAHLARHDSLTGIPNRHYLKEELAARLRSGAGLAVHYIDLDHFKTVNDTLGHSVGDALLLKAAERLRGALRPTDLVARIGGDEFAVIQFAEPGAAQTLASRLIEQVGEPFQVGEHAITIGTSIGIAYSSGVSETVDEILRKADLALYAAKGNGRSSYALFTLEMEDCLRKRVSTEKDLRVALSKNQFELFYQPEVDLSNGRIVCLEALIRWRHPERGLVSPGEFISIAEETGLISRIGQWVFTAATRAAANWPSNIRVAVNVSAAQFRDRDLIHHIEHALVVSGLAPSRLEVEITESLLLSASAENQTTLRALRALGVSICLDDFGTGYSSLSYLTLFPFDRLKIDRSFISAMDKHPTDLAIVRSSASLARGLGMRSTAEGIETVQQMIQAREEGCTDGQGFLFGEPMPAEHVAGLIRAAEERIPNLLASA